MTAVVERLRARYHIDTDDATDDKLLMLCSRAARYKAENFINRKLYEETVSEDSPEEVLIADDISLALMSLVGHRHENWENSSDVSKAPVPSGFSSLLGPHRFIPLQEETCRWVSYVIA